MGKDAVRKATHKWIWKSYSHPAPQSPWLYSLPIPPDSCHGQMFCGKSHPLPQSIHWKLHFYSICTESIFALMQFSPHSTSWISHFWTTSRKSLEAFITCEHKCVCTYKWNSTWMQDGSRNATLKVMDQTHESKCISQYCSLPFLKFLWYKLFQKDNIAHKKKFFFALKINFTKAVHSSLLKLVILIIYITRMSPIINLELYQLNRILCANRHRGKLRHKATCLLSHHEFLTWARAHRLYLPNLFPFSPCSVMLPFWLPTIFTIVSSEWVWLFPRDLKKKKITEERKIMSCYLWKQ